MSEAYQNAARRRGEARTSAVEAKIRDAMRLIEEEMHANGGVYPANGGAVNKNELARRAGISDTTLFAPKQKALKESVDSWLTTLKKEKVVGRVRVRRSVAERMEDWRKLHLALQNQHILLELELQDSLVKLDLEKKKVAELADKYEALLDQVRLGNAGKVAALPVQGKR